MVLVTLLASALGWFMYHVRTQREAVAAIQHAGGTVVYRWQWRNGSLDRFGKPGVPGWLLLVNIRVTSTGVEELRELNQDPPRVWIRRCD
jgi:hypothetical protein